MTPGSCRTDRALAHFERAELRALLQSWNGGDDCEVPYVGVGAAVPAQFGSGVAKGNCSIGGLDLNCVLGQLFGSCAPPVRGSFGSLEMGCSYLS